MKPIKNEVLLVFPPTTEARLFPYLSLPMITAYLRQQGAAVVQRDLNIELCHRLFSDELLSGYMSLLERLPELDLKRKYRYEMAQFLREEREVLERRVFEREKSSLVEAQRAAQFIRQGVELLLEGSVLKEQVTSLPKIGKRVEQYGEIPAHDLAAKVLYEMLEQALADANPKIFAVSVAYYSQILPALLLAKWVKALRPETFVIFGGQQMMLRQESLRQVDGFRRYVDAVGVGAGEEAMLKLIQALRGACAREEVPDVIWLGESEALDSARGPRANLHVKDVPPPDISDLPYTRYLHSEYQAAIITCVGCYWGRCAFCSYGNRSWREKSYQQKTARQIAEECRVLVKLFGATRINFVDENTNLRLVLNAMRILNEEHGLHIQFSTRNRLEDLLLDKAFVQELHDRGCVMMSVGYETNSQRLLDLVDKGVNAANYQAIIDNLHEADIRLQLSIMGGIADETAEEHAASEAFLQKNADKFGIDVMQMMVAEPHTFLSEQPKKYRIQLKEPGSDLRGNVLLNYGMGRMGHDFLYDGVDDFGQRQHRFLSIFHNVHPQKNENLPPDQRQHDRSSDLANATEITAVRLHPWVRVITAPRQIGDVPQRFAADLMWQRFYRLPEGIVMENGELRVADEADAQAQAGLQALLNKIAQAGVGQALRSSTSSSTRRRAR